MMNLDAESSICGRKSMCVLGIGKINGFLRLLSFLLNGIIPNSKFPYLIYTSPKELHLLEISLPKNPHPLILLGILLLGLDQVLP